jgi:DNA repair exonuclease SbcCD nuclease subunit
MSTIFLNDYDGDDLEEDEVEKKGIYVIGDTHFENKCFEQGEALIERTVEIAKAINPAIIILLGDIQHTHETAKQSPFAQTCRFIDSLSELAPTYVQVGNHDLINQTQFLSDNHFFTPYKKWPNVTIVDIPTTIYIPLTNDETAQIVTCPYTPPGRLIEALDTLAEPLSPEEEGIDWTTSTCIFGHQEIRGVMYGGKSSTTGDQWLPSFPLFISGHIHGACNIGDNVMYTGSSRQVASDESPDKKVWHILLEDPGIGPGDEYEAYEHINGSQLWIRKIELNIKGIKDVRMTYDEVKTFDFKMLDTHYITLHIKGTSEQFKIFKKGQIYAKMLRLGVKVRFDPNTDDRISPLTILGESFPRTTGTATFETIFHSLVQTKSDVVQQAYNSLNLEYRENGRIATKMVFVGR